MIQARIVASRFVSAPLRRWVSAIGALVAGVILAADTTPPTIFPALNSQVNEDPFEPIIADALEFLIQTPREACLDEVEIYAADNPGENLARDQSTTLSTSGTLAGFPIHQLEHIRDGRVGNDHSWLASNTETAWVRFHFPSSRPLHRIVWGRDRTGRYGDRMPMHYEIRVRTAPDVWRMVSSEKRRRPGLEHRRDATAPWLIPYRAPQPQQGFDPANTRTWMAPDRPLRITRWQAEDGLPSQSLLNLARTPDGFLWLATARGLVRFDGRAFTTLTRREFPSLPSGQIMQIETLPSGELWVRNETGDMARIRDHKVLAPGTNAPRHVSHLMQSQGRIVAADGTDNLYMLLDKGWIQLPKAFTTLADSRRNPMVDESGQGWIITGQHEWSRITHQGLVQLPLPAPFNTGHLVQAVLQPGQGLILIHDSGATLLSRLDGTFKAGVGPPNLVRMAGKSPTLWDRVGRLWMGSYGSGLIQLLENGTSTLVPLGEVPERQAITGLVEDSFGSIWIATAAAGLFRIAPDAFAHPEWLSHIPPVPVHTVQPTAEGCWLGVDALGLLRATLNPPRLEQLNLDQAYVWTVAESPPGTLWVGTYGGGLFELHLSDQTRFWRRMPGVFFALLPDEQGGVWAGGDQRGLHHLTPRSTETWADAEGYPHAHIRAIARDPSQPGALWIGSRTGGLHHFASGQFTSLTPPNLSESLAVLALHAEPDGTLWIGTEGQGLYRLKAGTFHRINVEQGLISDWIHAFAPDGRNGVWLTSPSGLVRLESAELNAVADNRLQRLSGNTLNRGDGLPSVECTSGSQPLASVDSEGQLWVATHRGPAIVNPRPPGTEGPTPRLAIERVLANGKRLSPSIGVEPLPHPGPITRSTAGSEASITLPPGDHRLEILFTTIDTSPRTPSRCRYRMEGLEKEWTDDGLRRRADYSHLPPGHFRFVVELPAAHAGLTTERLSLGVTIQPSLLQMPLVRAALAGAAALVLAFVYRHRIRHLERQRQAQQEFGRRLIASQEAERKRIAAEIHDSLEQTLLVIKNQASMALRQLPSTTQPPPALRQISDSATEAIAEVRTIAANLRPYQIDRLGITRAVGAMIRRLSESGSIHFTVELSDINGLLTPEAEINLYRIVQECLNNIVRHSGANQAQIRLNPTSDGFVELFVSDNGCGFDVPRPSEETTVNPGFGITGLFERARMMGGVTTIDSTRGQGTQVRAMLPIQPSPTPSSSPSQP